MVNGTTRVKYALPSTHSVIRASPFSQETILQPACSPVLQRRQLVFWSSLHLRQPIWVLLQRLQPQTPQLGLRQLSRTVFSIVMASKRGTTTVHVPICSSGSGSECPLWSSGECTDSMGSSLWGVSCCCTSAMVTGAEKMRANWRLGVEREGSNSGASVTVRATIVDQSHNTNFQLAPIPFPVPPAYSAYWPHAPGRRERTRDGTGLKR